MAKAESWRVMARLLGIAGGPNCITTFVGHRINFNCFEFQFQFQFTTRSLAPSTLVFLAPAFEFQIEMVYVQATYHLQVEGNTNSRVGSGRVCRPF